MHGMAHYDCTTRFAVTATLQLCLLLALVILEIGGANAKEGSLFPTAAFLSKTRPVSVDKTKSWQVVRQQRWHTTSKHQAESDSLSPGDVEADVNAAVVVVGVVAPMKYIGPYPCLALRFPSLQKSLVFVVDTGANVNSVDTQIVRDLKLPVVLKAVDPPNNTNGEGSGVTMKVAAGAGGFLSAAGDIVLLGDCCLEGLPPDQKDMIFFSNLTAAAISSRPVLHGIVDGLLGDYMFLDAFPAGVEFDWHGTDGDPPTFIFYAGHDLPDVARPGLSTPPIPLERLPQSDLFSISIQINDPNNNGTTTTNTNLTAILDTGSPVTILRPSAAKKAGIHTVPVTVEHPILDQARPLQKQKQQTIGDDILTVGGIDGRPLQLCRSVSPVSVRVGHQDHPSSGVSLGQGYVYVGELPMFGILGDQAQVILGLDFLKQAHRMILRSSQNELWFQEQATSPQ
eukprot:scaffold5733_cov54-Attheya_sp.AAC.2